MGLKETSKIKRILWATDFSKESRYCLAYVKFFFSVLGTVNRALYVLPKFSDWVYEAAFVSDDELLQTIEKTRQDSLKKIVSYGETRGIPLDPGVVEGRLASEETMRYAKENNIDLIVVGRRGGSEIEDILIGSTTSRLIRNSTIPVLVVPRNKPGVRISHILCPLDFNDFALTELIYAINLARQLKAKLHVAHVSEFFNYKVPVFKRDKLIDRINEWILGVAQEHRYKIENIIYEIGEPAEKIIDIATKNKIDLITMTTHQRKGVQKFFLGSITEKVLMYSKKPVLVLPPQDSTEDSTTDGT